jgi:hypothetical protein
MEQIGNIKVLFIAGFGPIVHEPIASRKLYSQMLGINFKEETGGYLHTEALEGAKSFALWPLSQAAQSCFGKDSWPKEVPAPQAWLEFDVDNVERQLLSLNREGIKCSSRTGRNRGARLSAVSSLRKDCCSELLSLHRCEIQSNASYSPIASPGESSEILSQHSFKNGFR